MLYHHLRYLLYILASQRFSSTILSFSSPVGTVIVKPNRQAHYEIRAPLRTRAAAGVHMPLLPAELIKMPTLRACTPY